LLFQVCYGMLVNERETNAVLLQSSFVELWRTDVDVVAILQSLHALVKTSTKSISGLITYICIQAKFNRSGIFFLADRARS
jgi:hypothetical protein